MKLRACTRSAGFTLLELLISGACGIMMMAAVLVAGVALQRSFMAVEGYSMAQGDQLRVQDYMAMDCRRAIGATISGTAGSTTDPLTLTLKLPNYYDANGYPVTPTYTPDGKIQYGAGETTITYKSVGSSFIRTVNGVGKAIAANVDSFTVTPQDLTSSVTCSVTFAPRFLNLPGPGPINGTTVFSNTFLRNAVARQ